MADTVTVRNVRLVNPAGLELAAGDFRLNDRPSSLEGKTLGLLQNSKANSDKVLNELGRMLQERHGLKEVRMFNKHSASLPTKPDVIENMLNGVDVLITGVGD
jgi:hypothetical protein